MRAGVDAKLTPVQPADSFRVQYTAQRMHHTDRVRVREGIDGVQTLTHTRLQRATRGTSSVGIETTSSFSGAISFSQPPQRPALRAAATGFACGSCQ